MELNYGLQEALLALLCYDDSPGGASAVMAVVPPGDFDVHHKDIAKKAVRYLKKYKKPPGEHTLDLIEELRARYPKQKDVYQSIFHSMEETRKGINREYVLGQATRFARQQRLKVGMAKAIEELQRDDESSVDKATALLDEAKKTSVDLFDPGTFLHDRKKALRFLDHNDDVLPIGIPEFDEFEVGPARKRLLVYSAGYGTGKSWFMTKCAKQGLLNRWRTVYITNELAEHEVAQRLIQCLYSIGKKEATHKYQTFDKDELGRFVGFAEEELEKRPHLRKDNIREFLAPKVKWLKKRAPIVVKHFPAGMMTMEDLDAYLDVLEGTHGFIPDQLIVDMPDNFKLPAQYRRETLEEIYKGLKGRADIKNMAVCAPSQANREGGKAKQVKGVHIAGDYSKMGTADIHITYSQTMAEKEYGLARLLVDKNRSDVSGFSVLISQAYGIGQFCMDSVRMSNDYWRNLKDRGDSGAEGDDDD